MFSFILGLGYLFVMGVLVGFLAISVTGSIIFGVVVQILMGLLFLAPTSLRIQRPDHRFDWLKYF